MSMWDGRFGPVVKKWHWEKRRVWWPFLQCERSHKFLFLKKAYYGKFFLDWEYHHDLWLSEKEYTWKALRDD